MQIGKERKNEIATAIQDGPFPSSDFDTSEASHAIYVEHMPTGSTIQIFYANDANTFQSKWLVGGEPPTSTITNGLRAPVVRWLKDIEKDLATPDLFAEIGKPPQISSLAEEDDNRPFDASEQAEIAKWAAELKNDAGERYGIDDERLRELEEKIDYLVEASGRMGRKDWVILAVGYIGTTMLDSGIKEQILQGLAAAIGHLFGHHMPLLPPH
jgi:hypothetical protein